jgi:hypothetical protein
VNTKQRQQKNYRHIFYFLDKYHLEFRNIGHNGTHHKSPKGHEPITSVAYEERIRKEKIAKTGFPILSLEPYKSPILFKKGFTIKIITTT